MAGLHFEITADNSNLQRKLRETEQGIRNVTKTIESEGQNIDALFSRISRAAASVGVAFGAKEFVDLLIRVRGEFQQLEVAFTTMLGSEEKATALMQQLTETAAKTPFDLQGVANGARQLLAYGTEAENVNEALIRLGNIAAGLSIPLNDLVYLYGTTMTQGRLYTQDLNQFTGRGIPMIRELSKVMGVAEDEVKGLVEAGRIGFPEVQKVIENMTNEGGMFYNLMEEQSKTISGQISNIGDSISMMFNEIGQQSEGIINASLSAVSYLVENYEQVGRAIAGLVATYGVYRAAVIVNAAAMKGWTAAEMVHYSWLLLVDKAQKILNATMLSNPYVLVATAIAAVVAAMVTMKTEAERINEANEKYEEEKDKIIEKENQHRQAIDNLISAAGDESQSTDDRRAALAELERQYPKIFAKYDTELEKLQNLKKIKEEIAQLEESNSIARSENELGRVQRRIEELEGKRYKKAKDQLGRDVQYYMLSDDETAELQALYQRRRKLQEQVRKDNENAYYSNLRYSRMSNETLKKWIQERQGLLNRMERAGQERGALVGRDGTRTVYTSDELQFQINKLTEELNRRTARRGNSTEWLDSARKRYEDALQAYNEFISSTTNNLTEEEYEKTAKKLKEELDTAKKAYDRFAPKEKKYGQTFDIAQANEENLQMLEEYGQRVEEFNRDLQSRISSSTVDSMQEGLEKEIAQIRQNRQSQLDELERSVDELAEARMRMERETWLSAAPGRTEAQYRNTEGGRKTLSDYRAEVLQGDTLQLYIQRRQQIITDANNAERSTVERHSNEMLEEYRGYYERRNAVIAAYEKKRVAVEQAGGTAENLALLEEERDKELKSIDEEFAARQETYNRWGREITNLSVKQLEELLGELESRLAGIELGERLGVNGNADEAAQVRAKIESLKKSLKEAKLSPDKKDKSNWADLQRIIGECNEAFKEIGDTIGGVLGETVEAAGQLATGTMQAVSSFANMATAMDNGDTAEAITSGIAGATSALQTAMQVYQYFSNVFGADYSEFEEMEAQYERLSDVWDELIAKKKEYIDESYGVESMQAYEEAVQLLERQQAYARQVAQARAAAGASAGSHSIAYRQNEWLSGYADELYQYIAQNGNWDDITNALLGASSEELALVRDKMPEFWAGLDADFRKALEDIIVADEQIEELGDDLNAAITGVSFDEFNSQFLDMLSDMDSTAKDFAENFSDNIRKSLMQSLVANQYKDQIENLYDKWTEYAENGLTPEEVNELRAMYGDIVDALLAERDDINNAFGFSSGKGQQEASAGGFETMSQDTAEELNGRFTALNETAIQIANSFTQLSAIATMDAERNSMVSEIRNLTVLSNGHLENIAGFQKKIYEKLNLKLEDIDNHIRAAI